MKTKIFILFTAIAALYMLSSCTPSTANEETIGYDVPKREIDPALAASLKAYKGSEHHIIYGRFNNAVEKPIFEGNFMRSMPDSLDIVGLHYADRMTEHDIEDIAHVQKTGTKVLYCLRTADLTDENIEAAVKAATDAMKSYGFDGISIIAERSLGTAETTIMDAVTKVAGGDTKRLLVFEGMPTFISADNRDAFDYYVLDTSNKKTVTEVSSEITLAVNLARIDRSKILISAVRGNSLSFGNNVSYDAIPGAAHFVEQDGGIAGMAVFNIGQDYYDDLRTYTQTRQAIEIMNPAANQ